MKTLLINMLLLFTATLSFAQVPNYVPTNGLVGWWPFNGNANDESGNGNNGTVNGATLTTDRNGLASKAYSFDGNDWIEVQNSTSLNLIGSISVSVWGKLSIQNPGIATHLRNNSNSTESSIRSNAPINYDMANGVSGGNVFISSQVSSDTSWHHFIAIYDVNSNLSSFYIDGVLQGNSNNTISVLGSTTLGFGAAVYSGSPNQFFFGKLDDIGIWNRVLTQCEIANLYNTQVGTSNTLTQSSCNSYTLNNQTYTQSGTYTQNLTNTAGCDSIITLNLTINNSPTASGSSTGATFHGATDGTVNLTVSGGASPYSFNWSNGANTEDLNAVAAGSYTVTITDANNCSSTTSVTVNQPPLALVKSPESIISSALYPNPATAQTRLDLQLNQAQDFEIAVYNNLGQRIFNKNYSNTKELNENIDMRSWPAGQYFVEIKLPTGTETKKLIKE